jgi:SPP1 gp7 family putative phage head morphogenesis protein
MTEALINGVALGWNPRKTARAMREGLQAGALQRSLVIARTEQLRAYRTATLETYRQSGVVVGYKRLAAKSARTCIACLMADGTFYPLEESFEEHPNGRCTLVPVVKGRPAPEWETGRTWFERQPADVQRGILGPAAFEAWQAGAIRLEDLVERHEHPVWGGSLGQRSLRSLLGANDAGYFARLAIFRPRAVPRDLGADVARRAIQQGERLAEVQAMGRERLLTLRTSLQSATYLPKAAQHFGRHQHEFADLGIDDEKAYQALFLQHINRNDLQVFTYISSKPPHYRMWSMVGMDNGVVVLYNEDKQKHWSMFRSTSLAQYHDSGRAWWVEVVFSERGARIEPW